jgi:hypothetical protein
VVALIENTCWGGNLGRMFFKDAITRENLLWYVVKFESIPLYARGINELKKKVSKLLQ